MLISATAVRAPRLEHVCCECRKRISGPHLRMYGAADEADPPFVLRVHAECSTWDHPKVLAAKAALSAPTTNPEEGR